MDDLPRKFVPGIGIYQNFLSRILVLFNRGLQPNFCLASIRKQNM